MEILVLEVEDRTTLGKKVKALRREGITPANVFGHGIESQAIKVDAVEMEKILAKAGATHMITLNDVSSKGDRRVLIKGVQRDPITRKLLHVDFYQVRMKDKVKVEVPLVFQGESPASGRKDLVLLENLRSVEVECLPSDIPESIAVDLSKLAQAGDHLVVRDLTLNDNITVLTSSEEVIARVIRTKAAEVAEVAEVAGEGEEAVAEEHEKAPAEASKA